MADVTLPYIDPYGSPFQTVGRRDLREREARADRLKSLLTGETEQALGKAGLEGVGRAQRQPEPDPDLGDQPTPTNPRARAEAEVAQDITERPEDTGDRYEPMGAREDSPRRSMEVDEPTPMRGDLERTTPMKATRESGPSDLELARRKVEEREGSAGSFFDKLGAGLLAYAGQHRAAQAKLKRSREEQREPLRDYYREVKQEQAQAKQRRAQERHDVTMGAAERQERLAEAQADPSSEINQTAKRVLGESNPSVRRAFEQAGAWEDLTVDSPAWEYAKRLGARTYEAEQAARERAAELGMYAEEQRIQTDENIREARARHEMKAERAALRGGSRAALRAAGMSEGGQRFASPQQAAEEVDLESLRADNMDERYPTLFKAIEDAQQKLDEGRYRTRGQRERLEKRLTSLRDSLRSREETRQGRYADLRKEHQKIAQSYTQVTNQLEQDYGIMERALRKWRRIARDSPEAANRAIKLKEFSRGELDGEAREARAAIEKIRALSYKEYAGLRTSPQEAARVEGAFGVHRLDRPEDFTRNAEAVVNSYDVMRSKAEDAFEPGMLWMQHDSVHPKFMGKADRAMIRVLDENGNVVGGRKNLTKHEALRVLRRFRNRSNPNYQIRIDYQ